MPALMAVMAANQQQEMNDFLGERLTTSGQRFAMGIKNNPIVQGIMRWFV